MNSFVVIIGFAGFLIFLGIMYGTKYGIPGIRKYDAGFRLLDMRFKYSAHDVYQTFDRIGVGGRKAYFHYLWVDFCFIACFLIVMLAISVWVQPGRIFRMLLTGFAVARAALDVIENTILLILIHGYPGRKLILANVCSWATTLKFIALYLWILGVILSLIFMLF